MLTNAERAFFSRYRPAGYILFARNIENPSQVIALVKELRALDTTYQPLVLIDQEGGRVQRLRPPFWRNAPAMAEFGALYARDPAKAAEALRLNMQMIGDELRGLGVDVDCAPVVDVPVTGAHDIIGDRAFGADPALVSALAPAACEGLIDAGIVPVIKHIPCHGRAAADSHLELPIVGESLDALRASDFAPFRALCVTGLQEWCFAMTAHVVYQAIDPSHPATTSKTVIADIIRGEIGFQGLLMSDDLGMKALKGPFDLRAAAALEAGCDVVLHCDGTLEDMEGVAKGTGPLGHNALRALEASAAVRGKPRRSITSVAASAFKVLDAFRHG